MKTFHLLNILFGGFICLLVIGCQTESNGELQTQQAPVLASRTISSSTLDLVEIWRDRTEFPNPSPYVQSPPFLYVTKDKVVMSSFVDAGRSHDSYLTAFSLGTGTVIWQTRYQDPGFGTATDSAYLDNSSNKLYLAYSFRVSAFDLETGRQLWITENLGDHESYTFPYQQVDPSQLQIENSKENIKIDPSSGKVLSVQGTDLPRLRVPYKNVLLLNHEDYFGAFDGNGQLLWKIPQWAEFWPTFINDEDFIIAFGRAKYWIWRVNAQTGQDRWRSSPDIVSNYAIWRDRVIALREDGYLLSMDLETGQLFNYAIFDKDFKEAIGKRPFWVTANDPYLYVYFGDTQELIAYQISVH
jgi:outer membrane protein assembly factor BamB